MRLSSLEAAKLGVPLTIGGEFETDLLDLYRARFRVVGIGPRDIEVTRIEWTGRTAPPEPRPPRG